MENLHIDYVLYQQEKMYLDYVNNSLTVDNFATKWSMGKNEAENFLKELKKVFG